MAANDATGLENVGYVLAKGDLDVTWAESDGGQHVEHLDLDKDPMYVAWVIAQQWRQSPEQYHTMLDADSSVMSVGLVYDEKTNRVYMTMRVYQGSADQPNHYKSEGLYKPFDHSDLYGFKLKKMDFTGHDENGLNQSGQNTYKNHAGTDVRDWSADIEYRPTLKGLLIHARP